MTDNGNRVIEYIALGELLTRLHPQNAKDHNLGLIIESIKTHGYAASGLIDDRTGLFLAGHGRVLALNMMRKQGMEVPRGIQNGGDDWLVPVQTGYESESDVAALAYLVADNRLTIDGGWNEPELAALLQELHNSDEIDILASGFSADDLDLLLSDLGMMEEPPEDPGAQIDKAAELQEKWQVARGDVWQIGKHRIMCGDSTNADDVARLMGGVKAELVFTDPPYNLASENKLIASDVSNSIAKLKDAQWDKNFDLLPALECLINFCSQNLTVYICTSHHLAPIIWGWMRGWSTHHEWCVWNKPNPMPSLMKRHWTWDAELIPYATRGKHIFNFPVDGHAFSTWTFTKHKETGHPTEKPVEVPLHAIKHSSNNGGIVLDVFLGSGTTIVACEQTGRVGYGMEIAPEYVSVCLERLSDMGLTPERSNANETD